MCIILLFVNLNGSSKCSALKQGDNHIITLYELHFGKLFNLNKKTQKYSLSNTPVTLILVLSTT